MNAITVFDKSSSFNVAKIEGTIRFSQAHPNELVFVHIQLQGFPPNGSFACHVHMYGDLSEGCKSVCAHFNPYHRLHGSYNTHGRDRHAGDLAVPGGNLQSDRHGKVEVSFYDDLISLFWGERCILGRSIVIHEHADDGGAYRHLNTTRGKESGITGNAGKRIACAIIGIAP